MSKKTNNYEVVIASILLGALACAMSIYFISKNAQPKTGTLQLYLSNYTKYIDGVGGDKDTLFIGADKMYREYLDELKRILKPLGVDERKAPIISKDTFCVQSRLAHQKYYCFRDTTKAGEINQNSLLIEAAIFSIDSTYISKVKDISDEKNHFFNRYPKIMLWILLISMAIGFSFCLIPICLGATRKYWGGPLWVKIVNLILPFVFVFFVLAPFIVSEGGSSDLLVKPNGIESVFEFGFKKNVFYYSSLIPFVGVICWLMFVFTISFKVSNLNFIKNTDDNLDTIKEFEILRKHFEQSFIIIAILLAFTIGCNEIFISGLNDLVNAKPKNGLLPVEFSFVNGLVYSFFLMLLYFVINFSFQLTKNTCKEAASKQQIKKLELDKGKGFLDYLKLVLTIMAPMIAGSIESLVKLVFGA